MVYCCECLLKEQKSRDFERISWNHLRYIHHMTIEQNKPLKFVRIGVDLITGESLFPKLEAAEDFCESKGYLFEFWTDVDE